MGIYIYYSGQLGVLIIIPWKPLGSPWTSRTSTLSLVYSKVGFWYPSAEGEEEDWFWFIERLDAYWLQRFHGVYNGSRGNTMYYFSMLQILKLCLQVGFTWNVLFWVHVLFGGCHNWCHTMSWVFIHLPPDLVYKIYVSIALFHTPECNLCALPFLPNWSNSIKKTMWHSFCRVSVGGLGKPDKMATALEKVVDTGGRTQILWTRTQFTY